MSNPLRYQAENDDLRLQEIEDRKRIQQLLEYDPVLAARSGASTSQAGHSNWAAGQDAEGQRGGLPHQTLPACFAH
eukprot:366301-Chlamydomonas_euryale.AAC.66